MLAPPAHSRILTWDVTGDKDLRRIRDGLAEFFREGETAGQPRQTALAQTIGLVATELAGNALRHGSPPVTVRLLRSDDCFLLDVSDAAVDRPPDPPEPRPGMSVGGRGLLIVLSVAQEVCWYTTPQEKHVWATFPVPTATV